MVASALSAPWVLWALARGLGLERGHPFVAAMAVTPYMALLSPAPVLMALALRAWVPAALAVLAAIGLGAAVLPRAIDGPQVADARDQGRRLTVMTANLLGDSGDPRDVVRLVREQRIDVLSLQELTPEALEGLDRAGIRALLPARVLTVLPGASGTGLMARRPLRAVPTGARVAHAQPEAVLRPAGGYRLRVKAVHPVPPTSGRATAIWRDELRAMPGPREDGVPRLLIGDFNATLDQRELRRLLDRGYYDAADATGDGLRPTWPLGARTPPITIDHVLVPEPIRVRSVQVREVSGSDHRAVIAELVLPEGEGRGDATSDPHAVTGRGEAAARRRGRREPVP